MKKIIQSRIISRGKAAGEALVSDASISFFGGVDPKSGVVIDRKHPLYDRSIEGKVLIFTTGKGSTVGSYVLYQLAHNEKAPVAMICREAEPIVAVGAIMAGIPMVDKPETFDFKTGQKITVDGHTGVITVEE